MLSIWKLSQVVLDLGALVDHEPELAEDLRDLAHRLDARVERAAPDRPAGRRDVDRLGREARRELGPAQARRRAAEGGLDRRPDGVGDRADLGPVLGGQAADPAQHRGQAALLAEDVELERLERRACPGRPRSRQRVVAQRFEVAGQVGEIHVGPGVLVAGRRITNPRSSCDVEGSSKGSREARTGRGGQAPLASSTMRPKVAASRTARSARIFRSISISAFLRPAMNWP